MSNSKASITIIGDGAMATVCALLLANNGHKITLWSAFEDYAQELARTRENKKYLPGFSLPTSISITSDVEFAFACKPEIIISAVPCQYLRVVWDKLKFASPKDALYVSVTKGIENDTLSRPSEILTGILGNIRIVILSGPSIALEVAQGLPATVVSASNNVQDAQRIQSLLSTPTFRIYTNEDVLGVELAGAMKNVIALAAGIIDGLKIGDNAKAALLTRGLVEITRLGVAMGARQETFAGLAGLGDLVTTCISPHGRNRRCGELIGRGYTLKQVREQIRSVIEGVPTTKSVLDLAKRYNVEMPITSAVAEVLFESKSPKQAIRELMSRKPKDEFCYT